MAKFQVALTRYRTETAVVTVEAETLEHAERAALRAARHGTYRLAAWEPSLTDEFHAKAFLPG